MTAPPVLTGRQRKRLRGLAHALEPAVQVGAAGPTAAVLREIDAALTSRELIKVRLREFEDKHELAARIAEASGAASCGLIGHVLILYRPHPETPRLVP